MATTRAIHSPPEGEARPRIPSAAEIAEVARRAGLDAFGLCSASPFDSTRRVLEERKRAGLHGGMEFTYRNPARSTDPSRILAGARSLVVGARSYHRPDASAPGGPYRTVQPTPAGSPDPAGAPGAPGAPGAVSGRVARYAWTDSYRPLRRGLREVAAFLKDEGWQARVVADDNALVDRAAAHRAGLGWYGKNTLLLLPGQGSWFVLGSVVTDAPLLAPEATDPDPVPDGCGPCRRCQAACPTGALSEAGVLDARRCLAWLLEAPGDFPEQHRRALGDRIYGCDECQEVCPVNIRRHRRADARADDAVRPAATEGPGRRTVDLLDLLSMEDERLIDHCRHWYIPGREARYIRRNALVALGNTGDPGDPEVHRTLKRIRAGSDPMLAEHARWAVEELGRRGRQLAGATTSRPARHTTR